MTGQEFVGWVTTVTLTAAFVTLAGGEAAGALVIAALIVTFLFV